MRIGIPRLLYFHLFIPEILDYGILHVDTITIRIVRCIVGFENLII